MRGFACEEGRRQRDREGGSAWRGEMNVSHASVHPVEDPTTTDGGNNNNNAPRVRMKNIQGMPGTKAGLALRVFQFFFAAAALAVMAATSDFPSVTAFR